MEERDPDFVVRYLAEVEALAEEVMAGRQQIVDLDQKRNQNREAWRTLSKGADFPDQVMVCLGNMFVQLPKTKTKDMLQKDLELLDEEITKLRKELKVKVNRLLEVQGWRFAPREKCPFASEEVFLLMQRANMRGLTLIRAMAGDNCKNSCLLFCQFPVESFTGKPELKGFDLKPLNTEEMWFIRKVVEG